MPYTTLGKQLLLRKLKGWDDTGGGITHLGLYDEDDALTGITSDAATDVFTKAAHGLSNGHLGVFRALAGGAGLKAEYPYFVVNKTDDTFKVSEVPGGASRNHASDVTDGSFVRLVEISGGDPAYARKAIGFNDPVEGAIDDSTNGAVVDVPACTVNYAGFFTANTAGVLLALVRLAEEVFPAQGTYTVDDADLDLNNDAVP